MKCLLLTFSALALFVGCDRDRERDRDTVLDASDATESVDVSPDAATDVGEDGIADTGPDTSAPPPPNIAEALDCGAAPPAGPGTSRDLQRHEIDTKVFPDALCNNGDPAVIHFRPYAGEANRNKWLISLNGGGGCGTGDQCAARWCWCRSTDPSAPGGCEFAKSTTNFSMGNMNADDRPGIDGTGITLRGDAQRPNPFSDYNQVRIVYCSSDVWVGTRREVPLSATHPKTGEPVSFSIHFLGSRILDAVLSTLRRDGVDALRFTFDSGNPEMPDLDDAAEVVLSGDSAGGSGVISNLDRVRDLLVANNTGCQAGSCPLVVRGLMDAIVGPDLARLDYSESALAEAGLGTTYADFLALNAAGPERNFGTRADASCQEWHAQNAPGTSNACFDQMHVIRHHVTTPFFVRMALLDGLVSSSYIESGVKDPALGAMTLMTFAQILQRELAAFPNLRETAEEGSRITTAPGVFAPACPKHDTIHSNPEVYGTAITFEGDDYTLFDVYGHWVAGDAPSAVLTRKMDRSDTVCGDP
jgi:hypothetical protein